MIPILSTGYLPGMFIAYISIWLFVIPAIFVAWMVYGLLDYFMERENNHAKT